jgi:hypothetical protein
MGKQLKKLLIQNLWTCSKFVIPISWGKSRLFTEAEQHCARSVFWTIQTLESLTRILLELLVSTFFCFVFPCRLRLCKEELKLFQDTIVACGLLFTQSIELVSCIIYSASRKYVKWCVFVDKTPKQFSNRVSRHQTQRYADPLKHNYRLMWDFCISICLKSAMDVNYDQTLCSLHRLAGVCCPDHLYSQKIVTTEKTYDTTSVVK